MFENLQQYINYFLYFFKLVEEFVIAKPLDLCKFNFKVHILQNK
jgi:hypothetical protein